MCWITFRKLKTIELMLATQSSRWLDGVGLIYQNNDATVIHKLYAEKDYKHWVSSTNGTEPQRWYFTDDRTYSYPKLEDMYQDMIQDAIKGLDKETFVFAHHRKWTVGSNGIENTHPFDGKKFILAQNWTDKRIHEWGIIEGIDPDRADTYVLLQYLEMHCNTLAECIERIKILLSRKVVIGTIMIYCKTEKHFMIFADWERSLYIEKKEDWSIDYIQSRKDDTKSDYKTEGYIIFDWNWRVISEDLKNLNKEKTLTSYSQPLPPVTYTWTQAQLPSPHGGHSSYYGSRYDRWNEYDDWWDYHDWAFQEINPNGIDDKINDVNAINELEELYQWIDFLDDPADVLEYLEDIDEKEFAKLKSITKWWGWTEAQQSQFMDLIIYASALIRKWTSLVEAKLREIQEEKKVVLTWPFKELQKEDIKDRGRRMYQLRIKLVSLNSYKEIFKL